jgi:hypothetical protein
LQVCVSERQKQNNKNTVDQEKERYLIIWYSLYSRTSNNGHCRGIQILSVIGGVR